MKPIAHFRFCPRCGQSLPAPAREDCIQCPACGFCYYFNPTVSAAAIILGPEGRALFLRRSKEPVRGKLALPGGFIDFGETAEEALRREIREEVGIEVEAVEFLCSQTNQYHYQEVTYPVVDLFFVAKAKSSDAVALDGAESICWLVPSQVNLDELAFPSVRAALQMYLATAG
jgi:mutator protein MutT